MKVYIIQGHRSCEVYDDYDTYAETYHYLLEAYVERKNATKRIRELKNAVSLWNRSLLKPRLRKGVRAEIFLKELQKKIADPALSQETTYSIETVELKE